MILAGFLLAATAATVSGQVWELALDIVGDQAEFRYEGSAWTSSSPVSHGGSQTFLPYYETPVVAVKIEINGMSAEFDVSNTRAVEGERTLQTLVTTDGAIFEPCKTTSSSKPWAAFQSATGPTSENLFGIVHADSQEPLYLTETLLFNVGRQGQTNLNTRIGLLRDEEVCGCCPGTVEGVGLKNVASGRREFAIGQTFFAAKVWVKSAPKPGGVACLNNAECGSGICADGTCAYCPDGFERTLLDMTGSPRSVYSEGVSTEADCGNRCMSYGGFSCGSFEYNPGYDACYVYPAGKLLTSNQNSAWTSCVVLPPTAAPTSSPTVAPTNAPTQFSTTVDLEIRLSVASSRRRVLLTVEDDVIAALSASLNVDAKDISVTSIVPVSDTPGMYDVAFTLTVYGDTAEEAASAGDTATATVTDPDFVVPGFATVEITDAPTTAPTSAPTADPTASPTGAPTTEDFQAAQLANDALEAHPWTTGVIGQVVYKCHDSHGCMENTASNRGEFVPATTDVDQTQLNPEPTHTVSDGTFSFTVEGIVFVSTDGMTEFQFPHDCQCGGVQPLSSEPLAAYYPTESG